MAKRASAPKTKSLIGRPAWLNDFHCNPKQIGACRIVGPSLLGPAWVIVEWTSKDCPSKRRGDVDVVMLAWLDVR